MNTSNNEFLLGYIKEHFSYDFSAGRFRRIKKTNKNQKLGVFAGSLRKDGYIQCSIYGRQYLEHRLVWLFFYKTLPKELDHINRNPLDNRISNLREATRSINMHNTRPRKPRALPKGVYKHSRKFRAIISISGVRMHLGLFNTPEEAETAYLQTKHRYFDE